MSELKTNPLDPKPAPFASGQLTAMPVRYVIFSPKRGVYLGSAEDGKPQFSKGHKSPTPAPTFTKEETEDIPALLDAELREVWPDLEGGMASVGACANAGLPRWGE